MNNVIEISVTVDAGPERTFSGRIAWTLHELVQAAEKGCTPIEMPAPRWSQYAFRLRREGVLIETISEKLPALTRDTS